MLNKAVANTLGNVAFRIARKYVSGLVNPGGPMIRISGFEIEEYRALPKFSKYAIKLLLPSSTELVDSLIVGKTKAGASFATREIFCSNRQGLPVETVTL